MDPRNLDSLPSRGARRGRRARRTRRALGGLAVLLCLAGWMQPAGAEAPGGAAAGGAAAAPAGAAASAGTALAAAQALFDGGRYAAAANAARQVIEAGPAGPDANRARSLICQARAAGNLTAADAPMPLVRPNLPPGGAQPPAEPSPGSTFKPSDSMPPLRIQGLVVRPERLFGLPPAYCEAERKVRKQGVVILQAIIERDGCLSDISVLKPLTPCLDAAAKHAVESWVFAPASLDGLAVRVYYTLTVSFQLQKAPSGGTPAAVPVPPS